LEGTLAGFEAAIRCTALDGTGTLTNEPTFVKGTGVLHYTSCSVTKPAGIGCAVKESKVDTEELKATTNGLAANQLKFEHAGTKFASITIEGCSTAALNKTFPVTGSLIATTSGATTTTTHAGITAEGTLIFGGSAAGLEGALTIKSVSSSSSQQAYTCAPSAGSEDYASADAHCVTNLGEHEGTRGHVAITETTEVEGTSASTASETTTSTPSKLEGTLSGFETAIECGGLSAAGSLTNEETFVKGTGIIHYTSGSVKRPVGMGCKVKESKVDTEELKATTNGLAANKLKIEPAGTKFASITIEGCSTAALNKTFPVTGSLIATTSGATTTTTHAGITAEGTLIFGGQVAGLESALTVSRSGGGNPITLAVITSGGVPITLT
jgi:hypothetical protein